VKPDDNDALTRIVADRAGDPLSGTPQDFFQNLVASAHLPEKWRLSISGRWSGNALYDARKLIDWAILRKVNPDDTRFTTLGAILRALLDQDLSPDDARTVAAAIVGDKLILDGNLLDGIRIRYGVPSPPPAAAPAPNYGPDFEWKGPGELELQSFLHPDPPWQDVGFLRRAMARSASVCRVEIGKVSGTGFIVAPGKVLTNYHVLRPDDASDIQKNAKQAILRFEYFTMSGGDPSEGCVYRVVDGGILDQSPVGELDFVLLQVEDKILGNGALAPAPLADEVPPVKSALNLLHHPAKETMKLSTSADGVTGVYPDRGLIQYATRAVGGSSGSPCFNDDWKVVALHHAGRATTFGSIREGILIGPIRVRIKAYLET